MSIKTIEQEKLLLLNHSDFNLNDAFKVIVKQKKEPGKIIQASKQVLSNLELNAALLSLPGQVISGDTHGCHLFCKRYSKNKLQ